jgi:hypothetical protein
MKNSIAVLASAALIAIGCNEAPTASSPDGPMAKTSSSTPANPALTYQGSVTSKGSTYRTVAVMDADGSHQTSIYGMDQPLGQYFMEESWSPTGSSICFVQTNDVASTSIVASIKAIDVSVNSAGTAVGSNVRTIYNLPTGLGVNQGLAWSSTTTMGKIAFTTFDPASTVRTLWVIPQAGGAPVKVWECDATYVKPDGSVIGHRQPLTSPTWSPDDHRLAVVRQDSATTATPDAVSTIMIFNTTDNGSTWTYADSIKFPGSVGSLEWSRNANGINKLAFYNGVDWSLYYVDPVTGAVPTTNGVKGRFPAWSPDNSALIFHNLASTAYLSRIVPFTSSVTNIVTEPAYYSRPLVRWKR